MKKQNDQIAFTREQGQRANKLFSAIVLTALDDAISEQSRNGDGQGRIARWARSKDGQAVLSCAGIDPNERVGEGMVRFVANGQRSSASLARQSSQQNYMAVPI